LDMAAMLARGPVIPVLVIEDVDTAVPLARALCRGGLTVLEVTLRTPAGLTSIERIAAEVPEAIVGVGTVLTREDLEQSAKAGARFAVTPGLTDALAAPGPIPLLPGAATASEIMRALDEGFRFLKFFPAVPAGGVGALKALAGPFADITFCPTGGVDAANADDFLALPNVICVGGSWVAPTAAVRSGDWSRIESLARAAASKAVKIEAATPYSAAG
jgi:2-dehydro-3-deoxyphosphogluconate aldolase / (4S)-4-hydroxy-2-oxoglutarate aldolase